MLIVEDKIIQSFCACSLIKYFLPLHHKSRKPKMCQICKMTKCLWSNGVLFWICEQLLGPKTRLWKWGKWQLRMWGRISC